MNATRWKARSVRASGNLVAGVGAAFYAGMLYTMNRDESSERALDIGAASVACILMWQGRYGVKPICEIENMIENPRNNIYESIY